MTKISRPRGAVPTPRHKLASATPHRIAGATPAQFAAIPPQLSMWMNGPDPGSPVPAGTGDCVSAEEAFAKAMASVMAGGPELFITDATLYSWASAHGVLDGAELLQVMQWMQTGGFVQGGVTYNDGSPVSVDWTNAAVLQNAISMGPVKIGVAGDQLENVVGTTNGWFGTGFSQDNNEDHCVSLCGYGTLSWLASQLGVSVPGSLNPGAPGYLLFTWKTIGIIDVPSMLAITHEAWLRNPTTTSNAPTPSPTPAPVPTPVPTPTPTPAPSVLFTMNFKNGMRQGSPISFRAPVNIPAGRYSVVPAQSAGEVLILDSMETS